MTIQRLSPAAYEAATQKLADRWVPLPKRDYTIDPRDLPRGLNR